jgi:hypothetical protein
MISSEFKECRCCQDVLDVLEDEIGRMTPHNTVTALGRLAALSKRLPAAERAQVLASPPFVAALQLLARQFADMNAFQVVNALYSAAVMGAPLAKAPALMAAADAALARLSSELNARDVCSALYALALLKHARPAHGVAQLLLSRAQSLLDTGALDARGVSTVLWAAGSLGLRHSGLSSAATRALLADGGALLRGMTSQGVANCVWGLAKANGGAVDAALLEGALGAIAALGDECKPQEVLNTLWACARCRHDPGPHWAPLLRYCARHASSLAPADAASLFHALGTFGHAPDADAAAALLPRARELLPRMAPLEACSLYRGLGLSGLVNNDLYDELTSSGVPRAHAAGQLAPSTKRMAFQGFLAGRLQGVAAQMPPEAATGLAAAWRDGLAARPSCGGGSGGRRSALGAEVRALLQQLGVRHDADVATRDGLLVVDLQLRAGGGRWVALQVAGEHEFTSNGGTKLGAASLQQAVLERNGYEVRWLSAHDLGAVPRHRRPLYVAELLRALGVGVDAAALRLAEQQAEGGAAAAGAAAAAAGGPRGRGGRSGSGGRGDFDGGVVKVREAELLFDDPKVSGGRGRRGGGGGGKAGARRR